MAIQTLHRPISGTLRRGSAPSFRNQCLNVGLSALLTAGAVAQEQSFAARMLYQSAFDDVQKAKEFHGQQDRSAALFHLARAMKNCKELTAKHEGTMEAQEAGPFIGTIRKVIAEMDEAEAKLGRVPREFAYVEKARRPEADEDLKFLKRVLAKQAELNRYVDRGHWGPAAQEFRAAQKAIIDFSLTNQQSPFLYALVVVLDEITEKGTDAEGAHEVEQAAYEEQVEEKRALARSLLKRKAKSPNGGTGHPLPLRLAVQAPDPTGPTKPPRLADAATNEESLAAKRELMREKLRGRSRSAGAANRVSPSSGTATRGRGGTKLPTAIRLKIPAWKPPPSTVTGAIDEAMMQQQLITADALRGVGRNDEALSCYARVLPSMREPERACKVAESAAGLLLDDSDRGETVEERLRSCGTWFEQLKRPDLAAYGRLAAAQHLYRKQDTERAEAVAAALAQEARDVPYAARQAQMLCALCSLRLRKRDAAVARLRALASSEPADDLATRAQFLLDWVLTSSRQDPHTAAAYDELIRRFLDSRYATDTLKQIHSLSHQRK